MAQPRDANGRFISRGEFHAMQEIEHILAELPSPAQNRVLFIVGCRLNIQWLIRAMHSYDERTVLQRFSNL